MRRGTSDSAKGKGIRVRAGEVRDRLVTEFKEAFRNTADAEGDSDPSGGQATAELPADAKPETIPPAEASVLAEPEAPPFVAPAEADAAPLTAPSVDPLPARMLNEFVYCPRLFYYEYVEGVFVDNADTKFNLKIFYLKFN